MGCLYNLTVCSLGVNNKLISIDQMVLQFSFEKAFFIKLKAQNKRYPGAHAIFVAMGAPSAVLACPMTMCKPF